MANGPAPESATRDLLQDQLSTYASDFGFESLSPDAIQATKVRILDTLGALFAGFDAVPSRIARQVARRNFAQQCGATLIGTDDKVCVDMAAFVNATASRFFEINDVYYREGTGRSGGGHPSDFILPIMAASEYVNADGKSFLTAVALAYDVYIKIVDATTIPGFDATNFAALAAAVAIGQVLGLSREQMGHCVSLVTVPNNALNQTRKGEISMWKAAGPGQAGRAAVFAALLARESMEGPSMPFEGDAGWFKHVASNSFSIAGFDPRDTFGVCKTLIKPRPSCAWTISAILAAEKTSPEVSDLSGIARVVVETFRLAKTANGTGEHRWRFATRESADHSIPYVVAAAIKDGVIGAEQFDESHLRDPEIADLVSRVEVIENPDFTRRQEAVPMECWSRVTVEMKDGSRVVGESGGSKGDFYKTMSNAEIEAKVADLTRTSLTQSQTAALFDTVWRLEDIEDVSCIPPLLVVRGGGCASRDDR